MTRLMYVAGSIIKVKIKLDHPDPRIMKAYLVQVITVRTATRKWLELDALLYAAMTKTEA